MEMAVCMEPICGTAEIPSGDLALSPSQQDWLMEGGASLSLSSLVFPLPPSSHPLGIQRQHLLWLIRTPAK